MRASGERTPLHATTVPATNAASASPAQTGAPPPSGSVMPCTPTGMSDSPMSSTTTPATSGVNTRRS